MSLRMSVIVCVKCILLFGLLIVNEATDRISVAKCNDYQKICPLEVSSINIEGEVAASKEFPFMALLGYEDHTEVVWRCSGSLISETFVLTAGYCVTKPNDPVKYVRLGDLDFKSDDDDAQVRQFNVTDIFLHPEYERRSGAYFDIALVKIDRRVEFNQYIQPICLLHPSTNISDRLIATGWGRTSQYTTPISTLQKVQLNLVPNDVCNGTYNTPSRQLMFGLSNEGHLCAGSNPGERDTCAGFGGGPLLNTGRKFSCLYEIVGITSFGKGCGNGNPGVYTRIASYLDWIESIVWPAEK